MNGDAEEYTGREGWFLQLLETVPNHHPHPQPFSLKGEGSLAD